MLKKHGDEPRRKLRTTASVTRGFHQEYRKVYTSLRRKSDDDDDLPLSTTYIRPFHDVISKLDCVYINTSLLLLQWREAVFCWNCGPLFVSKTKWVNIEQRQNDIASRKPKKVEKRKPFPVPVFPPQTPQTDPGINPSHHREVDD